MSNQSTQRENTIQLSCVGLTWKWRQCEIDSVPDQNRLYDNCLKCKCLTVFANLEVVQTVAPALTDVVVPQPSQCAAGSQCRMSVSDMSSIKDTCVLDAGRHVRREHTTS